MRVLSYDPYNPDATHNDDLEAMLAECDVVSMHAIVTPETEGLMGAAQFAAMKPGAIYINTARAMLHDTDALVAALQSGHLGGAGLDHFKGENLADRPPALRDAQRRADAAHRRRDLRHRSEPFEADRRRRRPHPRAARSRSTA